MKNKTIVAISSLGFLLTPFIAFAQSPLENLMERILSWVNRGVPILLTIATIVFIWIVIQYIKEKDPKEMEVKQKQVRNGIIGLFVIIAVWGIIAFIAGTLGIEKNPTIPVPCPPGQTFSTLNNRCQ